MSTRIRLCHAKQSKKHIQIWNTRALSNVILAIALKAKVFFIIQVATSRIFIILMHIFETLAVSSSNFAACIHKFLRNFQCLNHFPVRQSVRQIGCRYSTPKSTAKVRSNLDWYDNSWHNTVPVTFLLKNVIFYCYNSREIVNYTVLY